MNDEHPHRLPRLRLTTTRRLPIPATRILHKLSTITSPSHLPPLLTQIISTTNLLSTNSILPSTFISTSLLSFHLLSPAIRLLSALPSSSLLLHPFNTILRSLPCSLPASVPFFLFLQLLHNGVRPNRHTFIPLLSHSFSVSVRLHSRLLKSGFIPSDPALSSSLLHIYSAHSLSSARQLFDEITNPDVVAWTSLMSAYNSARLHKDALMLFERMHYSNVLPNRVTFITALTACSDRGALDTGRFVHEAVKRNRMRMDAVLGTALVDMYAKCGRLDEAIGVFQGMETRNVFTWNAVIGGFAMAKSGEEAMEWFCRMEEEGLRPDQVTVIEVLKACCHSGLVEMGRRVFNLMLEGRYGFRPGVKHYGCMVDLLSRAGFLEEAMQLIVTMPFQPGVVVWGAMLGGCRAHGNSRLGEIAAKRLVEMEPGNVAHYVVLANLYVEMGRWREAEELRRVMKERGFRKGAGWSMVKVEAAGSDSYWEHDIMQNF